MASIVRIFWCVLTAAVFAFAPRGASAQPPGQGDCDACTSGTYCHWEGNEWVCHQGATFCTGGALTGWNSCSDHPPYGSCTVSGGVCPEEFALIVVPEGIVNAGPEVRIATTIPCAAARRAGAVTRVLWIDPMKPVPNEWDAVVAKLRAL